MSEAMPNTPEHNQIKRVAVLGAGTMGAQIAALIANKGIPCDLLDLRSGGEPNQVVEQAKERLRSLRPPPLEKPEALDLIHPGNFTDDMARLHEADWVIEAIVEKSEPKKKLWASAAPHLRPDAIISTNTSGIPISEIADALPQTLRGRFLGTHFFNPPRYLQLLEIIPTPATNADAIDTISNFAKEILEKGVVKANDVPGFITNRIGMYYFLVALQTATELGMAPDEVDAISGPLMGRSNSATYRTLDLVGLDIFADICDNTNAALTESWEKAIYQVPPYIREMLTRGWLGEKSGQGFYKRTREGGKSAILMLHTESMEYHPRQRISSPLLDSLNNIDNVGERIRTLVNSDDKIGEFAWRLLSRLLAYSAQKVGEVADDIISIDRAMRLGFNWQIGPFETWDALGLPQSIERMQSDGLEVPDWVTKLANQNATFGS